MARDMDFSGSRGRRVAPKIASVPPLSVPPLSNPGVTAPAAPTAAKPTTNTSAILIWLIIIIIVGVGIFAAWRYFQPTSISRTATPAVTSNSSSDPAVTSANNLVATKNSLPTVQVYDSGAGPEAVTKTITNLKTLGYIAEDQAKSQFNYNKTYIWFVAGLEAEATKIQSALIATGRTVELKPSKSAGSFEIMILLGTK